MITFLAVATLAACLYASHRAVRWAMQPASPVGSDAIARHLGEEYSALDIEDGVHLR